MKQPMMISPRGVAAYTWLQKKDPKYGGYKLTLVLDKDELGEGMLDWGKTKLPGKAWLKALNDMAKAAGAKTKVVDGDKEKDKDGKPKEQFKGKWLLKFKTNFEPNLIDTKGTRLPKSIPILNGDVVRVAFRPEPREVNGDSFLSIYLEKVMLVEKRSTHDEAAMFGEEEGYVVPEDAPEDTDGAEDWDEATPEDEDEDF